MRTIHIYEELIAGVGYALFGRPITRRIRRQHDRTVFEISSLHIILKLKNNNFKFQPSPVCGHITLIFLL